MVGRGVAIGVRIALIPLIWVMYCATTAKSSFIQSTVSTHVHSTDKGNRLRDDRCWNPCFKQHPPYKSRAAVDVLCLPIYRSYPLHMY